MGTLTLNVACWNYDRVAALADGRVTVPNCELKFQFLGPEQNFTRAFRTAAFDVSDLSFSNYMSSVSRGDPAYWAIPVFLSRHFRHSAIFVRTDRGIRSARDLIGRTVGLQEYEFTAALVVRGILQDEYGVRPSELRWVVGDVEHIEPERTPVPKISGTVIEPAPDGRTLDAMLAAGEIDALVAVRPPPCFTSGNPNIARLFPEWRSVERDFYRRTSYFPIMHLLGVRRTLVEQYPQLVKDLFVAFSKAKEMATAELAVVQAAKITLPWVAAELESTKALLGDDFWPYGIAANRDAIARTTRFHFEQGLSKRRLEIPELFAPECLHL